MHYRSHVVVSLLVALTLSACGLSRPASIVPTAASVPRATVALPSPVPTAFLQASATTTLMSGALVGRPSPVRPTRLPTPLPTDAPLDPTPTLAPLSDETRERIFEQIWETVHEHYLYEDYRGVNWLAIRDEFAPKVEGSASPEEFYALMREMIVRLGDDHSRFESPQDVAEQDAEFAGKLRYGGIGAEIREVDEGGMVSSVVPDGPAAKAGIQPRDLITAIDGIAFTDREAFGSDRPISRVRGEPGTRVRLSVKSPGQGVHDVLVVRAVIDPDIFNRVSAQRLAGNIGLISIPSFFVAATDTHVRQAVEDLLAQGPLEGLLIDVRTNSGGYVHLMLNTIALFHNGGSIGSTSGRTESKDERIPTGMVISGMNGVPITVLICPETASAAEMFAAGMQVLGRAKVVGQPSAGNTENLYTYKLEDGSRIMLAELAYRLPDGSLIEGRGVIPDRTVPADWWRYPPDKDPQILGAIDVIRGR
ncbi:MAG: S41 family peptidase [Chloroflexales bacterium]